MFHRIISCLAAITIACSVSFADDLNDRAELPKTRVIDTGNFNCVYEHLILDKDIKYRGVEIDILQIGKNIVKYSDYGMFRQDSIFNKLEGKPITESAYNSILNRNPNTTCFAELFSNLTSKHWAYTINLFWGDNCRYEEPIEKINWTIHDTQRDFLGFTCQQATCSFKGRDWTVWFTEEIPLPYGPWKLGGLPGLILIAQDSTHAHTFSCIMLQQVETPIFLREWTENRPLVSKKEFYKRKIHDNLHGFEDFDAWERSNGVDNTNRPSRYPRLPNVELELDF